MLFNEDNTSSKRPRLSDPHTDQLTAFTTDLPSPLDPPPVPRSRQLQGHFATAQPQSMASLAPRIDSAAVQIGIERFEHEVKGPILFALDIIQGRCITCLLLGRTDWDTHERDDCSGHEMHYRYDQQFADFKTKIKFNAGFCYGCGLRTVRYQLLCSLYTLMFDIYRMTLNTSR